MVIFESISFTAQLKILCKKKHKSIYGSIKDEISDFFNQCDTLQKVWLQNEFIDGNDKFRLNKIRLPNRLHISGKSGGFRIVVICDKEKDTVTLLYIFPKVGPEKTDNIGLAFRKALVEEYLEQLKAKNLTQSEFSLEQVKESVTKVEAETDDKEIEKDDN